MEIQSNTEISPKAGCAKIPVQRLVILCYQCVNWGGDKEKVKSEFANNPISFDLFNGWVGEGNCKIEYEWATIDVNGNATAELTVPGNFGCPFGSLV